MKKILAFALTVISYSLAAQEISIRPIVVQTGQEEAMLTVSLSGATNMNALQFNLVLPEGVTLAETDVVLGTATNRHTLRVETLFNDDHLFFLYSKELNTFEDGELLQIPVNIGSDFQTGTGRLSSVYMATTEAVGQSCEETEFRITKVNNNSNIIFADANVKTICVANWDTNGDGELSEMEAAAVISLGNSFQNNATILSFKELQYFTGLTSINSAAFLNCSRLASVIIPRGVTRICEYAFYGCEWLKDIVFPDGITTIGDYAFYSCDRLTELDFPRSVISLGDYAFMNCNNLKVVLFRSYNRVIEACEHTFNSALQENSPTFIVEYDLLGEYRNLVPYREYSILTFDEYSDLYDCYIFLDEYKKSFTAMGEEQQLNITLDPSIDSSPYIVWGITLTSSDENVAVVEREGLIIRAVGNGTAIITVTAHNSFHNIDISAHCIVNVDCTNYATGIHLDQSELFFNRKEQRIQLTAIVEPQNATYQSASWWSSDESVATVDNDGWVTAMGDGTATIYACTTDGTGLRSGCTVNVTSLSLDLNNDGDVDVADIVTEIDYVLDGDNTPKGDINSDGEVDVADVVCIIAYIFNYQDGQMYSPAFHQERKMARLFESSNIFSATATTDGIRLALCNDVSYTAFQFMLTLPEGACLENIYPDATRIKHHSILFHKVSDGHYLVLGYALDNRAIQGTQGTLFDMLITNTGNDVANISDVRFVTTAGDRHYLPSLTVDLPTSITSVKRGGVTNEEWFDMIGRQNNATSKHQGVYIFNGKKVIVK